MEFATLPETKLALRIDYSDLDPNLALQIKAASDLILSHLGARASVVLGLDADGSLPAGAAIPPRIQLATIALVGYWVAHPDEDPDAAFLGGSLPGPVLAILRGLRDPVLA